MLGGTTLAGFARREAILASCLGLGAALLALSGPLDAPWLVTVAGVVAVAGALLRVGLAVRRARLERRQELAEMDRRTRVPVSDIGGVDPTQVGIDAAPPQTILPGEGVPEYLPRDADAELDAAVGDGFRDEGPWLIVVVGGSKVGKSRAMFESLRRHAEGRPLDLVAPVDADSLVALMQAGEEPRLRPNASVLWLDDLEPFVNQGVTFQTLREWHERTGGVVAATYGGKGNDLVAESGAQGLASITDEVLQHGREVFLQGTVARELEPLRGRVPDAALESIERHGLAAYLVAAPKLLRKLNTGIHGTGEEKCPEGVAVVEAAVDWARCGRTDAITEEALYDVWDDYLPGGAAVSRAGFEAGLDWALRPVAGTIALLERANSYRAYDYVVSAVANQPDAPAPRDSAWIAALGDGAGAQLLTVGISAFYWDRHDSAAKAFELARRSDEDLIAAVGGVNLGVTLGELDRPEEAIAVYDEMAARLGDSPQATLQEGAAFAMVSKGLVLRDLGRHEDAIEAYERVAERFGDGSAPGLQAQVVRARNSQAESLLALDRPEEAIECLEAALEAFDGPVDGELGWQVATAAFRRGAILSDLGHLKEGVEAFTGVFSRCGDADESRLRQLGAVALVNTAVMFGEHARHNEAIAVSEEVVAHYGDLDLSTFRAQVFKALITKAVSLTRSDRAEEALAVYDEAIARDGESSDPEISALIATALLNKAGALSSLRRPEEEIAVYDEVAARFSTASDVALRRRAAEALFAKGVTLAELDRREEAIVVYDAIVAGFGDSDDVVLLRFHAFALLNKAGTLVGREEVAVAIELYDEVLAMLGETSDGELAHIVAMALFNKAITCAGSGQQEAAVELFDQIVDRFGDTSNAQIRDIVDKARIEREEAG